MDDVIYALALISALGCGLTAGWFFAYSDHVMKALGRRPEAEGITTMNEINLVIVNSPLAMAALFVPALTGIALFVLAVLEWEEPSVFYHLAGSALYVVGTVGVTMALNVPRNNELERVEPGSAAAVEVWRRYLREWTFWNHVRTVAAFVATALLIIGLSQ